jgi:hypothetical protein
VELKLLLHFIYIYRYIYALFFLEEGIRMIKDITMPYIYIYDLFSQVSNVFLSIAYGLR